MRMAGIFIAAMIALAALTTSALADERVEHYRAKPSDTLEQAVKNFSEYNKKVAKILGKDQLSVSDMERIHEYSYTIEVALAKINDSLSSLAATLERVHLATEAHNADEVRGVGEVYLETARTVVP